MKETEQKALVLVQRGSGEKGTSAATGAVAMEVAVMDPRSTLSSTWLHSQIRCLRSSHRTMLSSSSREWLR